MRRFAIAVAVGAVAVSGCSSSGKSGAHATTTTGATAASVASPTTAPKATATTAVAGPGANGAPVVSASFVSAARGFAVEQSRQVDGTRDGGRTWRRVGTIPTAGPEETIRFIDAADGFAFARDSGPLRITHDAGATWTTTPTPFATVADLAIARGMVYVTTIHSGVSVAVQIWSTPVEHLVWKRDPLTLPVGAGPVATERIVLAGGRGWILGVNRTVVAGAQLTAKGTWAAWTPPCRTYGGTASLAASTAADLVAVCNPGPGTQSPRETTTTVELSHDGGTTFAAHAIPGAQAVQGVLSPAGSTAVIIDATDLRRTTDGATTWHVVSSIPAGAATDDGFTTTAQGFAIVGGRMLMTRDGGASWQRVSVP